MARRGRAREELISGLCMVCTFGAIAFFFGSRFWFIPMLFIGLIPTIRGAFRLFEERSVEGRGRVRRYNRQETLSDKEILLIARRLGGKVSASAVAQNSPLSIEEAEAVLEDYLRRGHASLEVREDGGIVYLFRDLF